MTQKRDFETAVTGDKSPSRGITFKSGASLHYDGFVKDAKDLPTSLPILIEKPEVLRAVVDQTRAGTTSLGGIVDLDGSMASFFNKQRPDTYQPVGKSPTDLSSSYAKVNPDFFMQDTQATPDMYYLIGPKTAAERYVMRNIEN